jgi:hypothetical protein
MDCVESYKDYFKSITKTTSTPVPFDTRKNALLTSLKMPVSNDVVIDLRDVR